MGNASEELGTIADGEEIPPSLEEITQDEAPIDPAEADEIED